MEDFVLDVCCGSPSGLDLFETAWGVGGDNTTSSSFYAAVLFGSVVGAVQMSPSNECSASTKDSSGDPSDDFM